MVDLFVGFRINNSYGIAISIKLRNHIKSLFVSILQQILNLKYSRHFRIPGCCVGLELFILAINLDVVSSFNVFTTLVFVFMRCNVLLY